MEQKTREKYLSKRLPIRTLVALGATSLGLIGANTASTSTTEAHPISIGLFDDGIRQEDKAAAQQLIVEDTELGIDSVKVSLPWTPPGQAEILNDQKRICVAAQLATANDLHFTLNISPDPAFKGKTNFPNRPGQWRMFATTVGAVMHTLKKCVPEMTAYDIEVGNEVNSKNFARIDDQPIPASQYVSLLDTSYKAVAKVERDLDITVDVVGGNLASNKKPLEFIAQMGQAKTDLELKTKVLDEFAYHPYPQDSTEPPATVHPNNGVVGMGDLDKLIEAVNDAKLGPPNTPIYLSEIGYESTIPDSRMSEYFTSSGTPDKTVTEKQQATYYAEVLNIASCTPQVKSVYLFHNRDDPQLEQWQSGLRYALSGDKKSWYDFVKQAITKAQTGDFECTQKNNN